MKFPLRLVLSIVFLAHVARAEPAPASFAYILQADEFTPAKSDAVERLAACGRDWLILDPAFDEDQRWTKADLEAIRHGQPGRKIVAYISIGEAETYRPYWRKEWLSQGKLTAAAPAWLGAENPEWKGNFPVKYWHAEWQKIMLAAIDNAMAAGFDGVYLDIVDGFETFEKNGDDFIENRVNPETKQSYRRDMVDWVKVIAARTRAKIPKALVIPQNGSELLTHEDFLQVISAIGIEDLFTDGNKPQPKSDIDYELENLKTMTEAKKPVLAVEYPTMPKLRETSKNLAHKNGLTWLVTDRDLKTLGESGK